MEPLCAYDTTGVLTVVAIGGTAPLLYSLNNGIPQTTGLFTGLPADMYKVTLIDNLGCSKDTIVQLSGPSPVGANITIEDTKCIDSKDGRLTVTGTGGQGGYKYYVTPGFNINKTGKFYGLAADTYTLRVVDTIGCEYMTVFTINPPANPLGNSMSKIDLAAMEKEMKGVPLQMLLVVKLRMCMNGVLRLYKIHLASVLYYGWYHLLIVDANGCEYKDSVYVEEGPCCDVTFIPNAFSPNGDNNNDEFKVFTTAGIELLQLEIYDRWGQRLWSTSDYKRGWDGKVEGKEAPVSTYFYVFKYICTRDGKSYIKKGDVTLIR
ncbi:MAG: gliding motility-associated C-terminal domain-containing protein [Bacteroidetes bacterium]|nr:gliding motility-associated C-terminal domain-containing protein [Bacteroidota bacterium]